MLIDIVIFIVAAISCWFGWNKEVKVGLIASIIIPAIISLLAAFSISLPTTADVGGIWVFVLSIVILTSVSLFFFGLTFYLHRAWVKSSKHD